MSLRSLKILAIVTLMMAASALAQQYDPAGEQQMVQLVNQERAKIGLPALAIDDRLTAIARKHSELLADKHSLSHQFPGEPDVRLRVAGTHMRFNYSGENVAYDASVQGAHEGFMLSPGHRENILKPEYNVIGIGIVRKGRYIYVTQDFAHRLPEVSLDQAEQTIASSFADLRRSAGAAPLKRVPQDDLRHIACEMARTDSLSTGRVRGVKGISNVVVWTATELEKLPPSLLKLQNVRASGYSLGACLSSSPTYPNPVYWFALVTYF